MINTKTLYKLVNKLQENKICCGIGGSYLLQIYNLCEDPQDVDFWVSPNDMYKVRNLFYNFEEIHEKLQLPEKYHFKFLFYDIIVDFVACFMVKPNKYQFEYNLSPQNIRMINTGDDVNIPCTSLEDWYIIYSLLGRKEKASLIQKYICNTEKDTMSSNRLKQALYNKENMLSHRIRQEIDDVAWDIIQFSLSDYDSIDYGEFSYNDK